MSLLLAFFRRFRVLLNRRQLDADLDEEMRPHVLQIPVLRGRLFKDSDTDTAPQAAVVRVALGAQRRNLLRMILGQGLGLASAGAAIGFIGAVIVSRLVSGVLYGVRPADPLTFAGVSVLLTFIALLACYLPARRALRIDPMIALRHEYAGG